MSIIAERNPISSMHELWARVRLGDRGRRISVSVSALTLTRPCHAGCDQRPGEREGTGWTGRHDQKHEATFDLNNDHTKSAKNYEEISFRRMDKEQSEYHDRYASRGNSYNLSPFVRHERFEYTALHDRTRLAWPPLAALLHGRELEPIPDGGWVSIPARLYVVSSYPWGWMPYRYGNWAFVPG